MDTPVSWLITWFSTGYKVCPVCMMDLAFRIETLGLAPSGIPKQSTLTGTCALPTSLVKPQFSNDKTWKIRPSTVFVLTSSSGVWYRITIPSDDVSSIWTPAMSAAYTIRGHETQSARYKTTVIDSLLFPIFLFAPCLSINCPALLFLLI